MAEDKNLAAQIDKAQGSISTVERPIPSPKRGQIVVRNRAVAMNPIDWKILDYGIYVTKYPNVLGSDVSGEVVAVGEGETHFTKGDKVLGFAGVAVSQDPDNGAWQTYTVLESHCAAKLPAQGLSYVQGVCLPTAMVTSAVLLFAILGLEKQKTKEKKGLLVWGAAGSIGAAIVQLASKFGYTVVATASEKHHGWITKLGAAACVDYKDPDVHEKLLAAAEKLGVSLDLAADAISTGPTFGQVAAVVAASKSDGSKKVMSTVLPWPEDVTKPDGVEVLMTNSYGIFSEHTEMCRWFLWEWLEKELTAGSIQIEPPPKVVEGGIEAAAKVFDMSRKGVSGVKLIVEP